MSKSDAMAAAAKRVQEADVKAIVSQQAYAAGPDAFLEYLNQEANQAKERLGAKPTESEQPDDATEPITPSAPRADSNSGDGRTVG